MQELDSYLGQEHMLLMRSWYKHRGGEGKSECTLCGAECERVVNVLWECLAYSSSRASFMVKLEELLGDRYTDFNSVDKTFYVLGSELWEQNLKYS